MNELEEKSLGIVIRLISEGYLSDDDAKILIKCIMQKPTPISFSSVTPSTGIGIKNYGSILSSKFNDVGFTKSK